MRAMAARKYFAVLRNRLLAFNEYKLDILGKFLSVPLILIVTVVFWNIVFSAQGSIGGFSLNQMIAYVVLAALFRRVFNAHGEAKTVEEEINSGNIIVHLCRPVDYYWIEVSRRLAKTAFLAAIALPFSVLTIAYFFGFSLQNLLGMAMASVLLFLAFSISTTVFFIIGIISFWTERSWGFKWAFTFFEQFLSGLFFPVTLFPPLVQKINFFLPFQHMMFSPVMLALGKQGFLDFLQSFAVLALWALALIIVERKAWNSGIKKFDGKG